MDPKLLGVTGTSVPPRFPVDRGPALVRYPELADDDKLTITKPGQSPWALAKEYLGPGATDAKIQRFVSALLQENEPAYGKRGVFHRGDEFKIPKGPWFEKAKPAAPSQADVRKAEQQMEALAASKEDEAAKKTHSLSAQLSTMAERVVQLRDPLSPSQREWVAQALTDASKESRAFRVGHEKPIETLRFKLAESELKEGASELARVGQWTPQEETRARALLSRVKELAPQLLETEDAQRLFLRLS